MNALRIRNFRPEDMRAVIGIILPIQRDEFGFAITEDDQPDLHDIPGFYQVGRGAFLVAEIDGRLVGTLGLKDIGARQGALRKMFVESDFRGREHGVAQALLHRLIDDARVQGLREIYLGTTRSSWPRTASTTRTAFMPSRRIRCHPPFPEWPSTPGFIASPSREARPRRVARRPTRPRRRAGPASPRLPNGVARRLRPAPSPRVIDTLAAAPGGLRDRMTTRLADTFARCRAENRAALVTYVMAGDPDPETSLQVLRALPEAGADIVEFGLPFTDPMADGPAIQAAGLRALKIGQTLAGTLELVRRFRAENAGTPVILMGYYNPIYIYGVARFLDEAKAAGIDGLIVVDLPPEEDDELCLPTLEAGLAFIRLATPTTDEARLPAVLANTSGFVYYVSITGITGTATPDFGVVGGAVERIRRHTDLPVVVGFGVKTGEHAASIARYADGVVVGSAIVDTLARTLDGEGRGGAAAVEAVTALVRELAAGVRAGRAG